jgi:hypothetical protein
MKVSKDKIPFSFSFLAFIDVYNKFPSLFLAAKW